ncbi:MAG: DUF1674 domain-containing protein [Nitratireductor sp.]|nr:DUF1674 domain-containing protein [Nitratireductor sp.]
MTGKVTNHPSDVDKLEEPAERELPAAAIRALEEARKRRDELPAQTLPREVNGRDGPEPTRFGDWEKDGIVSDF